MNQEEFENTATLPRIDLREQAFRKYEPWIAKACFSEQLTLDPKKELNVNSHTFKVRIRDAIRGLRLYKYNTNSIPPNFNFLHLKVEELADGRVLIKNTTPPQHPNTGRDHVFNQQKLEELASYLAQTDEREVHFVLVKSDEERKFVLDLEKRFDVSVQIVAMDKLAIS